MLNHRINPLICTDSYKISHPRMYPDDMTYMYDYVESRPNAKFPKTVFMGIRMFVEDYLSKPFTSTDIDEAESFYRKHFPFNEKVFDRGMFEYILDHHNGYFPVLIKAVPEGSVVDVGNILCSIEATDPYCAPIVSFLETSMLRYIWYQSTVATNSFYQKKLLKAYGELTSDCVEEWLPFALHDFGARGAAAQEAAVIGGIGHLVNFKGSDTLEAVYMAQSYYYFEYNDFPAFSVPASEHSVMSCLGEDGEEEMLDRIIDRFTQEGAVISIVNDTYDMERHLEMLGDRADKIKCSGIRVVTRPDSGKTEDSIITCLNSLWKNFGGVRNSKGYKVLHPSVRVIQGDNVSYDKLEGYLQTIERSGFSAENVLFGSGGGLLQKVSRDTQSFAMKCSQTTIGGVTRDVKKTPKNMAFKASKSGRMKLTRIHTGQYKTVDHTAKCIDLLKVVKPYTNSIVERPDSFEEIRQRTEKEL